MPRRVMITLDPEYIPWENSGDIARLRHQKPAWWSFAGLFAAGALLIGLYAWSQMRGSDVAVAGSPPVVAQGEVLPTLTSEPLPALSGVPGKLGLLRGGAVTFLNCRQYQIEDGNTIINSGTTERGPVIDAANTVTVRCDGQEYQF